MKRLDNEIKHAVVLVLGLGAVALAMSILSGCGKDTSSDGATGPQGPAGASASTTPVSANDADIADVLENGAHGNNYREGLGQTELSSGLSCQVVKVLANNCLSNSASGTPVCVGQPVITTTGTTYTYNYAGGFDQPSDPSGPTNLLPAPLQPLFVNVNYRIICTGYIVVQQPGWYSFEDQSDDGSILYLDGATLYNDGQHGLNTTPVTQSVYFTRDVHSFQLQYAQSGGGPFGLILTSGSASIPANLFYH